MEKKELRKTNFNQINLSDQGQFAPLQPREIYRLKASWKVVKDKMHEAGVELFLLYVNFRFYFKNLENCIKNYFQIKKN